MSKQLVATLTTDSNGEATFTYTGTGIGKVGFSAKYGTFQSETYDVFDCVWYDKALDGTGNHNDNYDGIANLTRTATGTSLNTTSAWNTARPLINSSYNINVGNGICTEFDVVEFDSNSGQLRYTIYDGTNKITVLDGTGHYKFLITDKIYVYKDNALLNTLDYDITRGNVQLIFTNSVTGSTFKFKDYKIYPI